MHHIFLLLLWLPSPPSVWCFCPTVRSLACWWSLQWAASQAQADPGGYDINGRSAELLACSSFQPCPALPLRALVFVSPIRNLRMFLVSPPVLEGKSVLCLKKNKTDIPLASSVCYSCIWQLLMLNSVIISSCLSSFSEVTSVTQCEEEIGLTHYSLHINLQKQKGLSEWQEVLAKVTSGHQYLLL